MKNAKKGLPAYPLGKKISYYREQKGITLNKLATLSGISQSYMRSIELQTQNPTVNTLILICRALGISLQQFFEDDIEHSFLEDPISKSVYQLNKSQKIALNAFLNSIENSKEKPL